MFRPAHWLKLACNVQVMSSLQCSTPQAKAAALESTSAGGQCSATHSHLPPHRHLSLDSSPDPVQTGTVPNRDDMTAHLHSQQEGAGCQASHCHAAATFNDKDDRMDFEAQQTQQSDQLNAMGNCKADAQMAQQASVLGSMKVEGTHSSANIQHGLVTARSLSGTDDAGRLQALGQTQWEAHGGAVVSAPCAPEKGSEASQQAAALGHKEDAHDSWLQESSVCGPECRSSPEALHPVGITTYTQASFGIGFHQFNLVQWSKE